ncbi:MAG: carboxypeptidase-like regulatory domain-containing protein [Bacteroidota bacterium]
MKFSTTLISLLLFLSTYSVFAQDFGLVQGSLVNEKREPIANVTITILEDPSLGTQSDSTGNFKLKVPANTRLTIQYSSLSIEKYTRNIRVKSNETIEIKEVLVEKVNTFSEVNINGTKDRDNNTVLMKPIETLISPGGFVEDQLRYLGANKIGGELSSAYAVRGGSFDENLVYVNDFEIYRPYLVRSGQQEGLSFSNPDLINNIKFSAGGFQAKYGDKMSSVLDVTYKRPKTFGGSISGSLLGYSAHLEGASKDTSFTFLLGFRNKSNQYLISSLQTQGQYSPVFYDVQTYMTYKFKKTHVLELLANYAYNDYKFQPLNRTTEFGLANQTIRITVGFDGQERNRYRNIMGGLAYSFEPVEKLKLKLMVAAYNSSEREAFDVISSYFIGEVEKSDINREDFNTIKYALGTGETHNFGRNELQIQIYNARLLGSYYSKSNTINWGISYKHEIVDDQLKEWKRLDSAGYSLPYDPNQINIPYYLKSQIQINSDRIEAHIQNTWKWNGDNKWTVNTGVRMQYWSLNKDVIVSPRIQIGFKPRTKKDNLTFTLSTGVYQQAPFYREMRRLDGTVNTNLKSQKSYHAVFTTDYEFTAWKRPFKFTTELYYKYLWDIVPYDLDNTLIRYFGTNNANGYAYGIDFRLNGELAKGDQSWISMNIMNARMNILDDYYKEYFDTLGNKTYPQYSNANAAVDSAIVYPGSIPLPTDQRISFNLFFQDHIPRVPELKVHVNMDFATGLPFGPPDGRKNSDTIRIPSYKRVDVGFSGQLYNSEWKKHHINKTVFKSLKSIWLSFDIFNILGINNTVSYLWIKDFQNRQFAVPNYLSNRRYNVRLVVKF